MSNTLLLSLLVVVALLVGAECFRPSDLEQHFFVAAASETNSRDNPTYLVSFDLKTRKYSVIFNATDTNKSVQWASIPPASFACYGGKSDCYGFVVTSSGGSDFLEYRPALKEASWPAKFPQPSPTQSFLFKGGVNDFKLGALVLWDTAHAFIYNWKKPLMVAATLSYEYDLTAISYLPYQSALYLVSVKTEGDYFTPYCTIYSVLTGQQVAFSQGGSRNELPMIFYSHGDPINSTILAVYQYASGDLKIGIVYDAIAKSFAYDDLISTGVTDDVAMFYSASFLPAERLLVLVTQNVLNNQLYIYNVDTLELVASIKDWDNSLYLSSFRLVG